MPGLDWNFGFNPLGALFGGGQQQAPWAVQQHGPNPWANPNVDPQTLLNAQAFGGGAQFGQQNPDPWAQLAQGVGTMNGLGGQIGSAFALANQQSGRNLANNYAMNAASFQPQAQMYESQQRTQRLAQAIPLFAALLSKLGTAGGGAATGFSTNYGAGGRF